MVVPLGAALAFTSSNVPMITMHNGAKSTPIDHDTQWEALVASPGELIDLVSAMLGVPRPAVFSAHRYLRLAGFITQGGRGTSAAKMTPKDAANLLIAAASPGDLKDSPAFIERPGGLISPSRKWQLGYIAIPELAALAPDHAFVDALEALIAAATGGSLQRAAQELEGGPVDLVNDVAPSLNIEVTILGPLPRGSILIEQLFRDEEDGHSQHPDNHERHFYGNRPTKPGAGNLAWLDIARGAELDVDLRTQMTFTHRTIAAIGALLADAPKNVVKK
ncbi:MAG: hypothetical protein ACOH2N_11305 [Devosia sp.]